MSTLIDFLHGFGQVTLRAFLCNFMAFAVKYGTGVGKTMRASTYNVMRIRRNNGGSELMGLTHSGLDIRVPELYRLLGSVAQGNVPMIKRATQYHIPLARRIREDRGFKSSDGGFKADVAMRGGV